MTDYYCMYQSFEASGKTVDVIFGIGTTEEETRADAKQWIGPETGLDGTYLNDLYLAKCTKRVYNYVTEYGGDADDFRFVLENGIVKTEDC